MAALPGIITPQYDRLYIAVRADLTPGMQLAQAVHTAFQFLHEHPSVVEPWLITSNYLVIVSVPDENALLDLITEASKRGLLRSATREPDLDNEATAIAIQPGPEARRLCAQLPLALKPNPQVRDRVRKAVTRHIGNTFGSGDEIADDIYHEVIMA